MDYDTQQLSHTLTKNASLPEGVILKNHDYLSSYRRPELIAVDQHPPLVAIIADLARDHLHRHADLHRRIPQVVQSEVHVPPNGLRYLRWGRDGEACRLEALVRLK